MTLIITVATPDAVHQSSDYRLTSIEKGKAKPTNDAVGAKQLFLERNGFGCNVAFTGLAMLGDQSTRRAIATAIEGSSARDPETLIGDIRAALDLRLARRDVRQIKDEHRELTVVIGVVRRGRTPRTVVLSNIEMKGRRLAKPTDALNVTWRKPGSSLVMLHGMGTAVSREDSKRLRAIARSGARSGRIQAEMREVNRDAAAASGGWVSEECMTSTIDRGLDFTEKNWGKVPGAPDMFVGRDNISALPMALAGLRQRKPPEAAVIGGRYTVRPKPDRPPGRSETFPFWTRTTAAGLHSPFSRALVASLALDGIRQDVTVVKNRPTVVSINNLKVTTGSLGGRNLRPVRGHISNMPLLNGKFLRPGRHTYSFVVIGGVLHVAFELTYYRFQAPRGANIFPWLQAGEELVAFMPFRDLSVELTGDAVAQAPLTAFFLLRDVADAQDDFISEMLLWKVDPRLRADPT